MLNVPANIEGADFIIDTECTGLNIMKDRPLYMGWRLDNRCGVERWTPQLVDWMNDHLPTANQVITHNVKYDCHMMLQGGVLPSVIDYTPFFCTIVGAQLCNEHRGSYSLDNLGNELFGIQKLKLVDVANIANSPFDLVEQYVNQDTLICQKLFLDETREIESQVLGKITRLEMQVVKVLIRMERRGVPIFKDRAEKALYAMRDAIDVADDDLWQCVGYRTNPNSQPALKLAFQMLDLPIPDSFDKEHLELISHPVAEKILDYRQVLTCKNVFVERLQDFIDSDGRIHCNINQNKGDDGGTKTGRLSMTDPNLQQIPMRVKNVAKVVRSLFGEKGLGWCSGDWSQFEYRIFGHFVGDENVLEAYRNNPAADFHQALATITELNRDRAKRLNLSLVFGAGEGKTAKMMGLPHTEYKENGVTRYKAGPEALQIFNQYHSRVPKTKPYLQASAAEAEAKGFIRSIFGRKIRFPDRSKAYKAGGLRFQSSAADLMKLKLVELDQAFMSDDRGAELVLAVHDEFDALCPDEERERTCKIMKEIMEDVPELRLPVLSDVSHGSDWWEASA